MGFPVRQLSACLAALSLVALPTPVVAAPLPLPPEDPAVANQWLNPAVREADSRSKVNASIDAVSGDDIDLTVRNDSDVLLTDISLRLQRGNPVTSVTSARTALADEESTFHVSTPFRTLPVEIAPGETYSLTVTVDRTALGMTNDGVYPLLINLNGELGGGGQQFLTSERTLWQVGLARPEHDPAPVSMLLPLTAHTDIVPGETGEAPNQPPLILQSEHLAQDVAPGGRLRELLDVYQSQPQATCLAVDPELALTLSRMATGYQVSSERPNPVAHKPRLRDSWGNKNKDIKSEPGIGSADAQKWMQDLTAITRGGGCVVAMPWANTELNGVAATGNEALLTQATNAGPAVLSELLGAPVRSDIILPGFGYLQQRTVASLDAVVTTPSVALVSDSTLPADALPVGQRVAAVGFDGELAAQLATMGDTPATAGYANQWQRFDYQLDSTSARRLASTASLYLAASDDDKPLLVVPPSDVQAADARALSEQIQQLFDASVATPHNLGAYVAVAQSEASSVQDFPFKDPSVVTDTEIVRASQQAKSIDDLTSLMTNEPAIALTPNGFTKPLRRDLLRALTATGRRSISSYTSRTAETDALLNANRDVLQLLRSSVVLLPPGNVYTRTSESSPLLIVAENGLPLPVDARISYSGPEDAIISVADSLKIPARGSITTQMMADLPSDKGRTDLTVWLASQSGAPISYPVDIGVQTRTGLLGLGGIVALILAGLGFIMFHVKRR